MAFRRWFHGKGRGGPPYFNPDKDAFPPASIPREQLLNRWEQHTRHCPSCKKVRWLRRSRSWTVVDEHRRWQRCDYLREAADK